MTALMGSHSSDQSGQQVAAPCQRAAAPQVCHERPKHTASNNNDNCSWFNIQFNRL